MTRSPAPLWAPTRSNVFPSCPAVNIPVETFLLAHHIFCQIQLHMGFGFPKCNPTYNPTCLDSIPIPPVSPATASTSCSLTFYGGVLPGPTCSPMKAFSHLCLVPSLSIWTIPELKGGDSWEVTSSPKALFPQGLRFFQAVPWTGWSQLSWSSGLWSYFLVWPLLSRSWSPTSCGHCCHDCPWCSHPELVLPSL